MLAVSFLAPVLSVKFKSVDIFIGANQPGAWIAFCMAKILKKPYIVYLNQPNRIVYPRPVDVKYGWYSSVKDYQFLFKLLRLAKPLLSWFDKISIKSANRVLVNGTYIGDIIQNVYSVRTIEDPAGANYFPPEALLLKPHLAYSGKISVAGRTIIKPYALITNRHDPQKRFDYVIKAISHISKRFREAKLVIPGPYNQHTKVLMDYAKKLRLEDKIIFLGRVDEEGLQKLYRNCCVYCYPSPQEDFGLGPLEAGGWGVPTVAWNHGGPVETVEKRVTGFLAEPYKTTDFARKMLILFENPELRAKMGLAAWERTKNLFSWEKHVDILEKTILQFV